MDFAKKILGKYGWKEGDGLGKNNTGIAAPLKASLKFDNAGLGVDRATEFNDHWWERCFNEAASNVSVQVEKDGQVSTARKAGEEAVEISTKGYSARKLKKAKDHQQSSGNGVVYEHFLKSALLTQSGGEVDNDEHIKTEDIAVTKVNVLTDEELFKACGGRTAHKGARHGLKLRGKLARIEQQEREMLEKLQGKRNTIEQIVPEEAESLKKKKKKRKKENSTESTKPEPENSVEPVENEPQPKSKKSKKREAEAVVEVEASVKSIESTEPGNSVEPVENEPQPKSKKSKKREAEAVVDEVEAPLKPKKKKKKQKTEE